MGGHKFECALWRDVTARHNLKTLRYLRFLQWTSSRLKTAGMWRRVFWWIITDTAEKLAVFVFRVWAVLGQLDIRQILQYVYTTINQVTVPFKYLRLFISNIPPRVEVPTEIVQRTVPLYYIISNLESSKAQICESKNFITNTTGIGRK